MVRLNKSYQQLSALVLSSYIDVLYYKNAFRTILSTFSIVNKQYYYMMSYVLFMNLLTNSESNFSRENVEGDYDELSIFLY